MIHFLSHTLHGSLDQLLGNQFTFFCLITFDKPQNLLSCVSHPCTLPIPGWVRAWPGWAMTSQICCHTNTPASCCMQPRVHKNKSMQHHTLGSGTAEFQVTWPPKLREGTYLVKNVRARFEYRKTIAAHEKQVIMQEKAQPCASLWRKTLRPNRFRFLAIDAPIVDYVCLPLYHLTFLPLCNLSASFREEKRKKKRDKRVQVSSINSWRESAVYRAALPHRYTILYNTQKSRYLKFRRASAPQWRDQALHTLVLMYSWCNWHSGVIVHTTEPRLISS